MKVVYYEALDTFSIVGMTSEQASVLFGICKYEHTWVDGMLKEGSKSTEGLLPISRATGDFILAYELADINDIVKQRKDGTNNG